MAEHSEISWTDATFNPWWGCAKVSPACDNCYAERDANRYQPGKVLWGVDGERREFGDKHWNEPLRWARTLPAKLGRRPRVFCASMADVFDKNAPEGARDRLWKLIDATPELDWLLLTKRVGNVAGMVPESWLGGFWPAHAWLGSTVINQDELDRDLPKLYRIPAAVRFLSIEPMLGPISFDCWPIYGEDEQLLLHWVIAGGESGPKARAAQRDWFRSLRDQCADASVPFHFKQWGEWAPNWLNDDAGTEMPGSMWMDRMGKKMAGRRLDGVAHDGFPETPPTGAREFQSATPAASGL